ncbi:alanine racemase [Rhizobium laguerreae]|uniref:alanine racemase n=1 Tax=Rhizobium laguerreae TaxID=1076926 RepID=UPI001C924EB2|nr:alanine racemase [Rhizobium laguerreae]MBY3381835.1 alanine racemase [Rhizobium laguerreae]
MNNLVFSPQPKMDSAGGAAGILVIDIAALKRNYRRLSAASAPARAAAVVKADAYGLGAAKVVTAVYEEGCRHFFVALFSEALQLCSQLPLDVEIFVLNGLLPGSEYACAANNVTPVINSLEQLRQWSLTAHSLNRRLPAVLQFDTGMSRLGIPPEDRPAAKAYLQDSDKIDVRFIMSHLASADEPGSEQNAVQLANMKVIASEFPDIDVCFANSGAVFLGEAYRGVLTRPGIALYGGRPTADMHEPMEQVVGLQVAVAQTRTVQAGAKVGYSGTHIAKEEMRLATISAGYADGLPRSLSSRGAVFYRGTRLPIVGRVSMDSMTIDISCLPKDAIVHGSLVEVIGPHQTLEELASDAETISYEILTSLGRRYARRYV